MISVTHQHFVFMECEENSLLSLFTVFVLDEYCHILNIMLLRFRLYDMTCLRRPFRSLFYSRFYTHTRLDHNNNQAHYFTYIKKYIKK